MYICRLLVLHDTVSEIMSLSSTVSASQSKLHKAINAHAAQRSAGQGRAGHSRGCHAGSQCVADARAEHVDVCASIRADQMVKVKQGNGCIRTIALHHSDYRQLGMYSQLRARIALQEIKVFMSLLVAHIAQFHRQWRSLCLQLQQIGSSSARMTQGQAVQAVHSERTVAPAAVSDLQASAEVTEARQTTSLPGASRLQAWAG